MTPTDDVLVSYRTVPGFLDEELYDVLMKLGVSREGIQRWGCQCGVAACGACIFYGFGTNQEPDIVSGNGGADVERPQRVLWIVCNIAPGTDAVIVKGVIDSDGVDDLWQSWPSGLTEAKQRWSDAVKTFFDQGLREALCRERDGN